MRIALSSHSKILKASLRKYYQEIKLKNGTALTSFRKMRHFENQLKKYEAPVVINKLEWTDHIQSLADAIHRKVPATLDNCDGGLYVGIAGVAYMYYYIAQNACLSSKRQEYMDLCREYLQCSLKHVESPHCRDPPGSFILGKAGVYAITSLILKQESDDINSERYLEKYATLGLKCKPINFLPNGSDELFVGRAGYLCGALLLLKRLPKAQTVIGNDIIHPICSAMIQSGREYARRHKSGSPLMYAYYGTEYLGAAHGLSSILQMLISFPEFLKSDRSAEEDVRHSIDFMLKLEQPNFNYPPAMDEVTGINRRPESEELVHWCHGAPGIVYLYARAFKLWGDDKYLQACLQCGEITWQKGLLKKGPGICHGVAGSGYVFLLLYRLTGDEKHLHRAQEFARFINAPEFQKRARVPDSPYSLYEGLAGTVCFTADLLQPEKAEFPFFDIF